MKNWLDRSVKGFILDITGVIFESCGSEGGVAVPGSVEAVQLLRRANIPFRFCTNESTASREHLCKKLERVGFTIKPHEVTAPAPTAVKILRERNLRPFLLVKEHVLDEFKGINTTNPNCVVMGDAQDDFSYENVNRAFSVLINAKNPVLISMGSGRYYKETDGLKIDVGAYCKGLEYACGIQAEYVGKPDAGYFKSAVQELGLEPSSCVMIGDDIKGDVGGAQKAGLRGVLVRTGKYRPGDEKRDVIPDGVVDNLLEAIKAFLDMHSKPNV